MPTVVDNGYSRKRSHESVEDGSNGTVPSLLNSISKLLWSSSPNTNGNNNITSLDHSSHVCQEPQDDLVQTVLPEVACLPEESSRKIASLPGATLFHKTPQNIDGTFKKRERRKKHTLMGHLRKRDHTDLLARDSDSCDSMSSDDSLSDPTPPAQSNSTVSPSLSVSNSLLDGVSRHESSHQNGHEGTALHSEFYISGQSEACVGVFVEALSTPVCPPAKRKKRKSTVLDGPLISSLPNTPLQATPALKTPIPISFPEADVGSVLLNCPETVDGGCDHSDSGVSSEEGKENVNETLFSPMYQFFDNSGIVPPVATVLEEPQECDPVVDDDDVFVDCPEAAREEDHLVLHAPTEPVPLRANKQYDTVQNNSEPVPEDTTSYIPEAFSSAMTPFHFIKNLPPLPEDILHRIPVLPRPTRSTPKYTLVLDLDETLVHCSIAELDRYDFSFQVSLGEDIYDVSVCGFQIS
jgi:hypothetical protein